MNFRYDRANYTIYSILGNDKVNKGSYVQMSMTISGIGLRLLAVRTQLGYPQSKMAAILDISDKSYKNYELEKRELPLSVAVRFCEQFEQNLAWLTLGTNVPDIDESADLVGETVEAIFECLEASDKVFSSSEINKFGKYIYQQAASKGTAPADEAKQFFSAIG